MSDINEQYKEFFKWLSYDERDLIMDDLLKIHMKDNSTI